MNKSFQRNEYEIAEQKRPIKQIINTNNYNNRTQRISIQNENKYNSTKQESYN